MRHSICVVEQCYWHRRFQRSLEKGSVKVPLTTGLIILKSNNRKPSALMQEGQLYALPNGPGRSLSLITPLRSRQLTRTFNLPVLPCGLAETRVTWYHATFASSRATKAAIGNGKNDRGYARARKPAQEQDHAKYALPRNMRSVFFPSRPWVSVGDSQPRSLFVIHQGLSDAAEFDALTSRLRTNFGVGSTLVSARHSRCPGS
jgi:hypothetical protein